MPFGKLGDRSLQGEILGWTLFYAGIAGVAFGSAYYHLKPDDSRVVWDTLPVSTTFHLDTVGFCSLSLNIAVSAPRKSSKNEGKSLFLAQGYTFNLDNLRHLLLAECCRII